jgi:hypothetical protein
MSKFKVPTRMKPIEGFGIWKFGIDLKFGF